MLTSCSKYFQHSPLFSFLNTKIFHNWFRVNIHTFLVINRLLKVAHYLKFIYFLIFFIYFVRISLNDQNCCQFLTNFIFLIIFIFIHPLNTRSVEWCKFVVISKQIKSNKIFIVWGRKFLRFLFCFYIKSSPIFLLNVKIFDWLIAITTIITLKWCNVCTSVDNNIQHD